LDLASGWLTVAGALHRAESDPDRLTELATQLDAGVALRRLASLAEVLGVTRLSDRLTPPASGARLVALDPRERIDEAWTDRRWRVRWPTSGQQARALVAA
jgi:hypothetical protein